jgi:hypothetical protein
LIILGNASLVYTIIRKRQVFFALSNLATDTQTIAKLSTKSSGSNSLLKSSPDKSETKQNVFQTNLKSNMDEDSTLNREQSTAGTINNAMITTLAETPCENDNRS